MLIDVLNGNKTKTQQTILQGKIEFYKHLEKQLINSCGTILEGVFPYSLVSGPGIQSHCDVQLHSASPSVRI